MAFFDTLRTMGLMQQSSAPSQQDNPYGLTDQDMQAARMGALGQTGMQLLAAGMAMPSAQRAQILAGMNPAGAMQSNILNTAQMRLAQRRLSREDEQYAREQADQQRKDQALKAVTDQIKKLPGGQVRDAAMYFLQAGDLSKAGEIAFSQKSQFDPMTGGQVRVDYFGNPIGQPSPGSAPPAPSAPGPQAIPAPMSTGVPGAPQPSSVAELTDGWEKITGDRNLPPEFGGQQVDQLTVNWRRLTGDANLTPQEAQIVSRVAGEAGNATAGIKYLQDMRKAQMDQRNTARDDQQQSLQNNRGAAENLQKDFAASTKTYQTVVDAAQRVTELVASGDLSGADKQAVLYDFVKSLDPLGAVRDGDVQMAQQIAGLQERMAAYAETLQKGGAIDSNVALQIAKTMANLGNMAQSKINQKKAQYTQLAQARRVPVDMVFGTQAAPNMQGPPQPPIGFNLPESQTADQVENRFRATAPQYP